MEKKFWSKKFIGKIILGRNNLGKKVLNYNVIGEKIGQTHLSKKEFLSKKGCWPKKV